MINGLIRTLFQQKSSDYILLKKSWRVQCSKCWAWSWNFRLSWKALNEVGNVSNFSTALRTFLMYAFNHSRFFQMVFLSWKISYLMWPNFELQKNFQKFRMRQFFAWNKVWALPISTNIWPNKNQWMKRFKTV